MRGTRLAGIIAVGALTATAACGTPAVKHGVQPVTHPARACMVTDAEGLHDRSINAASWRGMNDAKTSHPNLSVDYSESSAESDYQTNLTQFIGEKCSVIVTVGGLMGDATNAAAQTNPSQTFAIVDDAIPLPNVYSMQFDAAQAAFLAGYLAAGMTKSGVVATYGGAKLPTVTIFMDGFVDGVARYNQVKGKNVRVLGWDKADQNGSFAGSFTDEDAGRQLSDAFVAQGADIIMPVADESGRGTADAALASHGRYSVIWTDQDGCVSEDDDCPAFLTTVLKNVSGAVQDAVGKAADGTLRGGTGSIGTLANNGVGLAPYHDFDSKIPAALKREVDQLRQQIIAGSVQVSSPSQPAAPNAPTGTAAPVPSATSPIPSPT